MARNFSQPGCGSNRRLLRSCQYSSPAFRQAARLMARARPTCLSGPMKAMFINWVEARVNSAIFTGVLMFCRA
ncbi:hypothetical protein D3C76_1311420 [compost metagenome]